MCEATQSCSFLKSDLKSAGLEVMVFNACLMDVSCTVINCRGSTGKYTYWPDVFAVVNRGAQPAAARVTAKTSVNPGINGATLINPGTL